MIPRILHRVIPETIPDEQAEWWDRWRVLHPEWDLRTWQDPLDPDLLPLTAPHWEHCSTGAQLSSLVRLEVLLTHGGVYVDSDMEPFKPLDPLLGLPGFGVWEDRNHVPDFILAAPPQHPAIGRCLELAIDRLDSGTWNSSVGVSTEVLPGRDDFVCFPPAMFAPYHYNRKQDRGGDWRRDPWVWAAHHWAGSWTGH